MDLKDVRNKTVSLWSYINSYKSEFRNNAYIEYDGVVECSTSLSSLQLWVAYYFQYREVIDDSLNDVTVNSISAANQAVFSSSMSNNQNSYTFTPPMPSSVSLSCHESQIVRIFPLTNFYFLIENVWTSVLSTSR